MKVNETYYVLVRDYPDDKYSCNFYYSDSTSSLAPCTVCDSSSLKYAKQFKSPEDYQLLLALEGIAKREYDFERNYILLKIKSVSEEVDLEFVKKGVEEAKKKYALNKLTPEEKKLLNLT